MKQIFIILSVALALGITSCNTGDKKSVDYSKSALIIVDMQYDFMEGGSLEVKNANSLIPDINKLTKQKWGLVVATKDWHPKEHISFASNNEGAKVFEPIVLKDGTTQVMWPDHCVQGTNGANLHKDIDTTNIQHIILKGQNINVDSYSAFFDNNHLEKTDLDALLKKHQIDTIYLVGLARDYCVRWTATDGADLGYNTYFIFDATKPVDATSDDKVLSELKEHKVKVVYLKDIIKE